MAGYKSTFAYKLIYIMRIPDEEHKGLIKIGEATLDSTLGPSQLPPCCDALNAAAHSRVKEYTHTAMVQYDLLHTELAIQKIEMDDGSSILKSFSDKDVHRIIKRAGYFARHFMIQATSQSGSESIWKLPRTRLGLLRKDALISRPGRKYLPWMASRAKYLKRLHCGLNR